MDATPDAPREDPRPAGPADAALEEAVRAALGTIEDPEIGLPITELGLVYEIHAAEGGEVQVVYTLTSMGCPVGPAIDRAINELTAAIPGVTSVATRIVFQPPWTPEKMSDDAKVALGYL